jgi:hypothetical protein
MSFARSWMARPVPDLILTGVPRSGTTLAAALVDGARDAFCLSEPDSHVELMQAARDADDFVSRIERAFDATREALHAGRSVVDKRAPDGTPITDYFPRLGDGSRPPAFVVREVMRTGLSPRFTLAVKHNALYASVLPQLVRSRRFRIVAIVRDPVAVLRSWRSLDLPISRGRLPAGERFWPELADLGRSDAPLLDRQIRIYELLCRRFAQLKDDIAVIRYEDIVASPQALLDVCGLVAGQSPLPPPPVSKPAAHPAAPEIAERIRKWSSRGDLPAVSNFYSNYTQRA